MKEKFEPPGILIGHSLGGAAVLHAASGIESARAVVTIGAPADPAHLKQSLKDSRKKIEKEGRAEIAIGGKSFTVKKQFLDDLESIQMQKTIRNLKKPLLIFHSPMDEIVDAENAAIIFKAAFHPKSFISLDKADHLLSNESDAIYVGSVIAAWADKYVDIPEKRKWIKDPQDNRILARIGQTLYRTDILANGHHLVADEPRAVGGGNLGPTPYDLLVSGLGACTCMTLRMYADRKKWPVESISVKLNHQKIHADECQSCETQSGKLDRIDLEIDIKGDLDQDQKKRMLEIAEKCPVHRTLHSEMITKAELKASKEKLT
jgi:putative redox protein